MKARRILHIEDSKVEQEIINRLFAVDNVTTVSSEQGALSILEKHVFELILLDLSLATGDGLTLCQKIKMDSRHGETPLMIISGRSEISDKVLGLDLGADDYLSKPFNYLELKARANALLRRSRSEKSIVASLRFGPFLLNPDSFTIHIHLGDIEHQSELTQVEYKLLSFLLNNSNRIVSRDQILQAVWGQNLNVIDRTVDSKISSLRKKIAPLSKNLTSIYGVGYSLSTSLDNLVIPPKVA